MEEIAKGYEDLNGKITYKRNENISCSYIAEEDIPKGSIITIHIRNGNPKIEISQKKEK
jgi:hypothetical protein